jgi:hypothetical protein
MLSVRGEPREERIAGEGATRLRAPAFHRDQERVLASWSRRNERWLALGLLTVLGCHKATVPAQVVEAGPLREASAQSAAPAPRADEGGLHSPDGQPWSGAERVDADVIRVTTLTALFVEANEIRCPHIVRSKSVPVQKDIGPWQVEGDLVETDALKAHSVSARLIIADEIQAVVIKELTTPHRWAGAGGASPVRNRVSPVKGMEAPSAEAPVF